MADLAAASSSSSSDDSPRDLRAEAKARKKAESERDVALKKQVSLENELIRLQTLLDKSEISDENKNNKEASVPSDKNPDEGSNRAYASMLDTVAKMMCPY